jgi:hypothetical protein
MVSKDRHSWINAKIKERQLLLLEPKMEKYLGDTPI